MDDRLRCNVRCRYSFRTHRRVCLEPTRTEPWRISVRVDARGPGSRGPTATFDCPLHSDSRSSKMAGRSNARYGGYRRERFAARVRFPAPLLLFTYRLQKSMRTNRDEIGAKFWGTPSDRRVANRQRVWMPQHDS